MIIKEDYGTLTGGELAVESIIAPVQKTLTAERAYAAGAYFIYDDKMYKATSAITSGSAIVLSGGGANATPAGTVMKMADGWVSAELDTTNVTDASHLHLEKNDSLKRARTWGYFDCDLNGPTGSRTTGYTALAYLYKNAVPKEYVSIAIYVNDDVSNAIISSSTGNLVINSTKAQTNARVFVSGEWPIN